MAEEKILVPNGLNIQTLKCQKMASPEISHRFLGGAKFQGQKNDFIASVHCFRATCYGKYQIKLLAAGKIKSNMNNLQPVIFLALVYQRTALKSSNYKICSHSSDQSPAHMWSDLYCLTHFLLFCYLSNCLLNKKI